METNWYIKELAVAGRILSLINTVSAPFICSVILDPIWYLYQFGTFFVLCVLCVLFGFLTLTLYLQILYISSHSTNTNHVCSADWSVFYHRCKQCSGLPARWGSDHKVRDESTSFTRRSILKSRKRNKDVIVLDSVRASLPSTLALIKRENQHPE